MENSKRLAQFVAFLAAAIYMCVSASPLFALECAALVGRLPGSVSVVAVSGDHAYLGSENELLIADVSDPSMPWVVGWIRLPGVVTAAGLGGDIAYVTTGPGSDDWPGGLHLIDVTVPSKPVEVGFIESPGFTIDVAIEGDLAFVIGGDRFQVDGFLQVVDVREPTQPMEVGFVSAYWWEPNAVAVASNHAYVTFADRRLRVFDVNVPSAPTEVDSIRTEPYRGTDIAVSDGLAYVSSSGGLHVIDVSTPSSMSKLGFFETSNDATGVATTGTIAYLTEGELGVTVIDVSVPSVPTMAGFVDTPGDAFGVAAAGDIAFVADGRGGLRVLDSSNPYVPEEVGRIDAVFAAAVAAAADSTYVVTPEGLAVIDVSDPTSPMKVGFIQLDSGPYWRTDVDVSNDHAYVVGNGFHVIDVSDHSEPEQVGFLELTWGGQALAVAGRHVYVSSGDGLSVIDVSEPFSAPLEITFIWLYEGGEIAVSDDHVFVLGCSLHIFDISLPSEPVPVSEIHLCSQSGGPSGFALSGGFAYVANHVAGDLLPPDEMVFSVHDVRVPSNPVDVAELTVAEGGHSSNISVSWNHAFMWIDEVLHVFDVGTPWTPVEERTLGTPATPIDLAKRGRYTYAAAGESGLYVLDTWGCRSPWQHPTMPLAYE